MAPTVRTDRPFAPTERKNCETLDCIVELQPLRIRLTCAPQGPLERSPLCVFRALSESVYEASSRLCGVTSHHGSSRDADRPGCLATCAARAWMVNCHWWMVWKTCRGRQKRQGSHCPLSDVVRLPMVSTLTELMLSGKARAGLSTLRATQPARWRDQRTYSLRTSHASGRDGCWPLRRGSREAALSRKQTPYTRGGWCNATTRCSALGQQRTVPPRICSRWQHFT